MSEDSAEPVKPVLARIPTGYADLPKEEQDRFRADLVKQLLGTMPEDQKPYRPDDRPEEGVE